MVRPGPVKGEMPDGGSKRTMEGGETWGKKMEG